MDRRNFLALSGLAALDLAWESTSPASAEVMSAVLKPDYTIRIAPVTVELGPGIVVKTGRRYRLFFNNDNGDSHAIHLHRHNFEIRNIGGKATAGIMKDIVNVPRRSTAEVDFVADNPGLSLFHCHMQLRVTAQFRWEKWRL